jgi:hypothetical protein
MGAYAHYSVREFLELGAPSVIDTLVRGDAISGFSQVSALQIQAWRREIHLLHSTFTLIAARNPKALDAGIIFEYRLPRRDLRVDLVILTLQTAIVVEFKVGASTISSSAVVQLEDYALDLRYYHAASAELSIIPVLCLTEANLNEQFGAGDESEPIRLLGVDGFGALVEAVVERDFAQRTAVVDVRGWIQSPYRPIPGIVEAAVALFQRHSVEDIDSAMAETRTLESATERVLQIASEARQNGTKHLCMITGVPGAGKTLAGLRIAHSPQLSDPDSLAVYLSGNGPLLRVLRAALADDYHKKPGVTRAQSERYANDRIQGVHAYLDHEFGADRPPAEFLVVFDEAQRAWDAEKMAKMGSRRRAAAGESSQRTSADTISEPERLLRTLSRRDGAAVLVALCGTGQEIHDGEAGVEAWVHAAESADSPWTIHLSPFAVGIGGGSMVNADVDPRLHLGVSTRNHRANGHSRWVDAVLSGDVRSATESVATSAYPILLTRDLRTAKNWLRASTLGTRRSGVLASSSAARLRPYGIEVSAGFRGEIDYAAWFTASREDLRSSHALEVAATEFECQGLELDRACVCWSWDLIVGPGVVEPREFRPSSSAWRPVSKGRRRDYLVNKYRVLLTRAREGMVIFVPEGDPHDGSRKPQEMDSVAHYLQTCGARSL